MTRLEQPHLENLEYYRKKETSYRQETLSALKNKNFDMAIENLMQEVATQLADELKTGVSKKEANHSLAAETYVDRYGRTNPGFITYEEFKDIYNSNVYYADELSLRKPPPEENKLKALFKALDVDNREKISRSDFAKFIRDKKPVGSFLDRIEKKALRGKERLIYAINEECVQADQTYGCHGVLPLPVF